MAATAGSPVGLHPRPGQSGVGRAAGVVAIAVTGLVAFLAFGTTVLDLGPYGLPALAVAAAGLGLAVMLVQRGRGFAALLVAAICAPAAFAAGAGGSAVGERIACGDGERHALAQIEHLGGARPGIGGDLQTGGCIVRYSAPAVDSAAVVSHYRGALGAGGWRLAVPQVYGSDASSGELRAARGAFSLWISWWTGRSSTRVVVSLND